MKELSGFYVLALKLKHDQVGGNLDQRPRGCQAEQSLRAHLCSSQLLFNSLFILFLMMYNSCAGELGSRTREHPDRRPLLCLPKCRPGHIVRARRRLAENQVCNWSALCGHPRGNSHVVHCLDLDRQKVAFGGTFLLVVTVCGYANQTSKVAGGWVVV